MIVDANAAGDAALERDFDEARFRANLLAEKADALGFPTLAAAAALLMTQLGPVGAAPDSGYGATMLQIAVELEAIGFTL